MSILTMRRRRSRDGERRRGSVGRPPRAILLAGAAAWLMLHGTARASEVTVDLGAVGTLPPTADAPAETPVHLHPPKPAKAPAKPRHAAAPPQPQHKPAVDAARTPAPKAAPPQTAAAKPPATPPRSPPIAANPVPEAETAAPPLPGMLQIPPPPVLPPPAPPAATSAAPMKAAPAKTAAATPPAKQQPPPAATAAAKAAVAETTTRLVFAAGAIELSADAKAELDRCAKRLAGDPQLRAEIDGYAEAGDASQARRISLSRVLAARGYLVERGVDVKQVDVRPLGNHTQPGLPPDRVDLVIAEQ